MLTKCVRTVQVDMILYVPVFANTLYSVRVPVFRTAKKITSTGIYVPVGYGYSTGMCIVELQYLLIIIKIWRSGTLQVTDTVAICCTAYRYCTY